MVDTVLVTGSTAIDQTGLYEGSFEEYQSDYPINAMNVSFQLGGMKTSFGGCAPNIAFGLNLLNIPAIPLSSAGRNFYDRYEAHLQSCGVNTDYITVDEEVESCATCLMINDRDGNQVIGFYPGPKDPKRHLPSELPMIDQIRLAILGPEEPELTLRQGRDLAKLSVPIMADPGQVTAEFDRRQTRELIALASYLVVNTYEFEVIKANAEMNDEDIRAAVPEIVVTRGEQGCDIYQGPNARHIDAAKASIVVEVTGCGDAFRAGYAYGILSKFDVNKRAQLGCVMAMRNLGATETQRYHIDEAELLALRESIYA